MARNTSYKDQAAVLQDLAAYVANDPEGRYEITRFEAEDAYKAVLVKRSYRPKGLTIQYHDLFKVGQKGAVTLLHSYIE